MMPLVRPAFLKGALLVLGLLTPFMVHAVWDEIEARRLARLVAEIRAAHEPTSVYQVEHQRSATLESIEAARYYRAAAALAAPSERDRSASPSASEALAFLDRAATLPFETFPAGTDYSYITAELISVGRLAHTRTRALAAAGDGDGAAASLYAHVRLERTPGLARLLAMWPQEIQDLQDVLSTSQPGDAALARLADAFAELDDDGMLKQILLRERAFVLDRETHNLAWWSRPLALKIVNDRLENYQTVIAVASQPWPRPLDLAPFAYVGTRDHREMMRSFDESKLRLAAAHAALARAARIAIAAVQFRRAHRSWPSAIAALVPEYLPAVPIDPYRGEPMRSIVEDSGDFVAYSVGPNNRDDHGQLTRQVGRDVGRVRPGMSRATVEGDFGLRLAAR